MDVLYLCRPGPNEELRYSLRSLANIEHDRVWIAGGWPAFVRGVETVPVRRLGTKFMSTTDNLRAALEAGIGERFALFNDDIFVMRRLEVLPTLHLGTIEEVASSHRSRPYSRYMRELGDWFRARGVAEPICYEAHAPLVVDRDRMREALELPAPEPALTIHKRSVYGNHFGIGGERTDDFKVGKERQPWSVDWPFLSTTDHTFAKHMIGRHIRAMFPDPSPYEAAQAVRVS